MVCFLTFRFKWPRPGADMSSRGFAVLRAAGQEWVAFTMLGSERDAASQVEKDSPAIQQAAKDRLAFFRRTFTSTTFVPGSGRIYVLDVASIMALELASGVATHEQSTPDPRLSPHERMEVLLDDPTPAPIRSRGRS
ncbi:MAG: hypothetical protein ACHREM_06355 [Polyangiales bacterium]